MRFGIIGAGRIGKIHGGNTAALPSSQVASSPTPTRAAAEALADRDRRQGREHRRDPRIASDVDAVLICIADRHPRRSHRARRHAPARRSSARSRSISTRPRRACLEVVEADRRDADDRLQPPLRPQLRRAEASESPSGAIGEVELVTIISRDPGPPPISYIERSGGLFRDMMIHDFDMARFLLGEEPVEVQRHGLGAGRSGDRRGRRRRHRGRAHEDRLAARSRQISNSRRATYGYDQRIEVHGSNGMLSARPTSTRRRSNGPARMASPATRC